MSKSKLITLVIILLVVLTLGGFGVFSFIKSKKPTAGLKVDASPASLVFVDNKQLGQTPIETSFPPGEVTIKIIPSGSDQSLASYQTKVRLIDKVFTVIKREFGKTELESAGEIVSAQPQSNKNASLAVVTSTPESASVSVDGQPQGFTPLLVSSIPEGEHQIVITAPGYNPRTISAQALAGYKLTINAKLSVAAAEELTPTPSPEATPSGSLTPTPTTKTSQTPTPTSKLTPTATPTSKLSPTPTSKATSPTPAMTKPYVEILNTPTGFLRVRSGPGKNFNEIGQVKPGEMYTLLGSQADWLNIKVNFAATSSGWISSEYAKKVE